MPFHDLIAGLHMGLDQLVLERRQLSGLAQELGRDIDLADVVDRGGEEKALDPLFIQAELASNRGRELRHAVLMACSVSVAHLDRGGDRLNGRFQAFLQGAKGGFAPRMIALSGNSIGKIVGQLRQKRDLLLTKGARFLCIEAECAEHC